MSGQTLPTGVVTFLLTDVQDSTTHWARPSAVQTMARQRELIATAVADHGGVQPLEQGEGDSTVAAFDSPSDALEAAVAIQTAVGAERWPAEAVSVRIGVHTGPALLVDERTYGGQNIIRCARLRDLASGGQVLVSAATAVVAQDDLPADVVLRELARVRLKGLERTEQAYQLEHPDLRPAFPHLVSDELDTHLPYYPTSFVGREAEIAKLADLVGGARVVTVTGAGGSGKTRVAHQVAIAVAEGFAEGVVWVDLCRVDENARVASEVATACGLAESPGGVDAITMVASHLSSNHRLVVIDNCEHVLDGAATLVEAVLAHDGTSVIVATSREPLGVAGETIWRIPSLELPADTSDMDGVRGASAVGLFCERARAGRPDFVLDASVVDLVVAICRRVDGIPLAIELAAARLRTMSLDDLITGLDDRFRLLAAGPRSLERQRTLVASIDWSHDLLDRDERVLFRRLGVFASPFGLAAAEAIGADDQFDRLAVFDVLARLVDKSLVQHDGRSYSMLETIRQYSTQKAIEAEETVALRRRHMGWFVEQVSTWGFAQGLVTADAAAAADRVLPDLRVALDWALEQDRSAAVALLCALVDLSALRIRELNDLARAACSRQPKGSVAWAELLAPSAHFLPMALTDWWIGPATSVLDDEALSAVARRRIQFGLIGLAVAMGAAGAAEQVEALIADARADGDERFEAIAAVHLAQASVSNGNLRRAEPLLSWCERKYPNHDVTPQLYSMRTYALVLRGHMKAAVEAVLNRPSPESRLPIMFGADLMAAALTRSPLVLGDLEAEIDRREFHGVAAMIPPLVRFWIAAVNGDLDAMEVYSTQQLGVATTIGQQINVLGCRAQSALARGDFERATTDIEVAATAVADFDQPLSQSWVGLITAEIDHAAGDVARAVDGAHQAMDISERDELRWVSIQLLEFLAVAAGADDERQLAARLLGACEAFREANSFVFRWPHAERCIDALRPRLDPEHVAQGAALSIDQAVAFARGSRGPRSRPSFGWGSLTPAELRVVHLVSEGLSNKQIAEKLFVTQATVKTHLVHVYQKLELSSRAEMIAAVLSRPADIT